MIDMYSIGIDLGGTFVKLGLVHNGAIMDCVAFPANMEKGLQPNLPHLKDAINKLLVKNNIKTTQLGGISLAFPGIVDPIGCQVLSTNEKYDDACNIDMQAWCKSNFEVDFYMDNDARMATVGEWKYGAAKGYNNMVMATLGTGIGTGVIIDGRVLYGEHFQAGSLGGHLVVDYKGRQCSCGNIGCAEAHASSFFLSAIIAEHPQLSAEFKLQQKSSSFETIFQLASESNGEAILLRNDCLNVWAAAIVSYIHAYDPQIVVIGGGVMNSKHIILPYVCEYVVKYAWCPTEKVKIVASELGENAAVLAAEYYVMNKMKKNESVSA